MTLATRITLIFTLTLLLAGVSSAQVTATAAADSPAQSAAVPAAVPSPDGATGPTVRNSREVRDEFSRLLRENTPDLAPVLALEPSLLSNEAFLSGYPDLARFVAANPEIRRSPSFYLAQFPVPGRSGAFDRILEPITIMATMLLIGFGLAWLVRSVIEQKRWNRLSKTQSEVHNKILDRFGSSEELLAYIRTPAGTKFLESAPIPLHAGTAPLNTPVSRVLWSIQLGVVVGAGAIGLLVVAAYLDQKKSQDLIEGLFAMGTITLCIGLGFIVSAAVSIVLSKRLGLWQGAGPMPADAAGDADLVR